MPVRPDEALHGARVQPADAPGVTPLAHAEQRGQRAIVETLRRADIEN